MKRANISLPIAALMLNLGVASAYAQQYSVRMVFSGNGAPSPINLLQQNTSTLEENVAGNGALGRFTFRDVRAASNNAQQSTSCKAVFFPTVAGAGIFRFEDGSLLTVNFMQGGDCIDFSSPEAHCTLIFQITGGTGRFKNASGVLTYTETAAVVLSDAASNPVFFTEKGEVTATIGGVAMQEGPSEPR